MPPALAEPNMALETAKLLIAAITPVVVAVIAFRLNRALQQVAASQWASQKVVEKRIAIFDEVAPALNDLYCFFKFVGDWKKLTPPQMVAHKRQVDRTLYIYSALFPPSLIKQYASFINLYFKPYAGAGHDAKLRGVIANKWGDRRISTEGGWNEAWAPLFVDTADEVTSRDGITGAYFELMDEFSHSLGIGVAKPASPRQGKAVAEAPPASEVGQVKKYETVVGSGQSALRALLTMNGGAIIVFLTFLGHVWDHGKITPESMTIFIAALAWWIGGIFSALMSYGAIFVTNCLSSVNWKRSSDGAFAVTVACGLISLVCFLIGSWRAVDAFQSVTMSLKP